MVSSIHRPTQAVVDLSAISRNIEQIQKHLPENTQTFAVVKADAYGHGAVAVANHIALQIDCFCVSNLDEALELRQAGLRKPILVLGIMLPGEIPLALAHDIAITVASLEWLERLGAQAITGLRVHLKLDTGMGRIGFRSSHETQEALDSLRKRGAQVEGIFTHFATADEADTSYFAEQLQNFKAHLSELRDVPELIHASNSATSLWHQECIFNAVRLGVAMYGLNPSGNDLNLPYPLEPALSLTSQIVHIKCLPVQQKIGYGGSYETQSEEIIATVPIGYADGWTRQMQGFQVLVDGEPCEIVGRVSMDQMTIKLPKLYPLGTPVTLIGTDKEQRVSATDVAAYRGTINYEVLCLLSERVPRIYH